MFYSKSTGGFYTAEIHGEGMPGDVVEISSEQHAELLEGQTNGLVIAVDQGGYPVLQDPGPFVPPVPTPLEQIEALERETMLPRPVRDFMLIAMEVEAAKQGITPEQLRAVNPGYRKVKELDEQIAALRALL